ncbi:delta(14)-sterol reductase Erg24p [Monosporozyma servazzii]
MSSTKLNPKTTKFEFGGIVGTTILSLTLPIFTIIINQLITPNNKITYDPVYYLNIFQSYHLWIPYLCWFISLAILDIIMPGHWVKGTTLRNGQVLDYKINGISNCLLLVFVLALRWQLTDGELPELQFLYEHYMELNIISFIFAFYLATWVYLRSFVSENKRLLALGGNSGDMVYDWFIGRELNPRSILGLLDIKLFCELRPGMLLWFLINLSCVHHVYLEHGQWNDALCLITVMQTWYIFDGVLNEEGLLSMMDIVTDGFGFMLSFGDLTMVPFTYALQARWLSENPIELGYERVVMILVLMGVGFSIFHLSNQQKSDFKQNKLNDMNCIETKRGTKLLCDGWWSMSQHINYFGDWLISLSWCLTTWFNTPLTYYYSFYFAILLIHRQIRDEEKCHKKYGKDWEEYQRRVPYKIIPYIY